MANKTNTKTTTTETKTQTAPVQEQTAPKTEGEQMFERATAILNDPKATDSDKIFAEYIVGTYGMATPSDLATVADKLNTKYKLSAIRSMMDGNSPKWDKVLSGVTYPQIDLEAKENPIKEKSVKMSDIFGIKTNSKSIKLALTAQPDSLFAMLNVFGSNICDAFHADLESACNLRVFTKYTDAPKCFFADEAKGTDPKSKTQLEKQLQTITDTIFGKDAVKIRKAHVAHLEASFTKATTADYRNGNEIALLQLIVNHARDAKNGKNAYTNNGKLSCQREPKTKK